jgi:uncharacterized protein YpmS
MRAHIKENWVKWVCMFLIAVAIVIMLLSFLMLLMSFYPELVTFLF